MDKKVKQVQSIVGTSQGRPENDFYPTPAYVTQALLDNYEFGRDRVAWECACGMGDMSEVLTKSGKFIGVVSSDKIDYGYGEELDFLSTEKSHGDVIITNPPFKLAYEFVEHCMDLKVEKFAFLCKLAFLEGQKRSELLMRTPLHKVLVFRKRITLYRNGETMSNSGMIAFAWFIWNRNMYRQSPEIGWI